VQTTFPPSYLYAEYRGDVDLQALVDAQNQYQQAYLDAINALNLPIYTLQSNDLLDWVLGNLYGFLRPVFAVPSGTSTFGGDYNTWRFNEQDFNSRQTVTTYTYETATDDQYKRCATWNFYTGDGKQFDATWLKRRVLRFLTGANGTDPGIQETYLISVTYLSGNRIVIGCDSGLSNIPLLQQALAGGFLYVPFQYTYSVVMT